MKELTIYPNAKDLIQIIHFIHNQRKKYVQNQIYIVKEQKFVKYSLDNLLYYLNLTGEVGINILKDCFLGKVSELIIINTKTTGHTELQPHQAELSNPMIRNYHCFHILEFISPKGIQYRLFSHSQADFNEIKELTLMRNDALLYTLPTTLLEHFILNRYSIKEIIAYCIDRKIKPQKI
jgi:hypothetical protein